MKCEKFDIRDLSDDEYFKWYSLMSKSKKERVDRFRFVEDKKRTVAGEMLARKMISEYCGVSPEAIAFEVAENGKPYAKGLNVHFNISHSGDFVVCAVDNNPVGIDIEKVRPIDYFVIKRVCSEQELNEINQLLDNKSETISNPTVLQKFFEIWTKKEATYKIGAANCSVIYDNLFSDYVVCIASIQK